MAVTREGMTHPSRACAGLAGLAGLALYYVVAHSLSLDATHGLELLFAVGRFISACATTGLASTAAFAAARKTCAGPFSFSRLLLRAVSLAGTGRVVIVWAEEGLRLPLAVVAAGAASSL